MEAVSTQIDGRNVTSSGGISNNRSNKGSVGGMNSSSQGLLKQQNVVIDIESEDLTYN